MKLLGGLLTAILLLAAFHAYAEPRAPQSIVIVACRVDDLTGQPGRHDPALAAKGWRDLELHIENGEVECKRIQIDLVDSVAVNHPFTQELNANFGDPAQCARVGVVQAEMWNEANQSWATVKIGCPTPIAADNDADGKPDLDARGNPIIIGWKLPECPAYLPGTHSPMRCKFDASVI